MSKYLLLTTRHDSIYGKEWALFWGCRESESNYSSDLRLAHRFTKEEVEKLVDDEEIAIPIDVLEISEGYEPEETFNKNIKVLIEKGTLNKLLGLKLNN